jgi:hypothetical protein
MTSPLVRSLLNGEFAPVTFRFGFVETSFSSLCDAFHVETNSNWTAVFGNGLRVNDVASATGYLPTVLSCRGLEIGHTPDFSESKRKDLIRKWGSTLFALYGPTNTDWLNRIRCVHVSNDVGGWAFEEGGEVQPFEEPEAYKKRRVSVLPHLRIKSLRLDSLKSGVWPISSPGQLRTVGR